MRLISCAFATVARLASATVVAIANVLIFMKCLLEWTRAGPSGARHECFPEVMSPLALFPLRARVARAPERQ